jgi:hypothetical protein
VASVEDCLSSSFLPNSMDLVLLAFRREGVEKSWEPWIGGPLFRRPLDDGVDDDAPESSLWCRPSKRDEDEFLLRLSRRLLCPESLLELSSASVRDRERFKLLLFGLLSANSRLRLWLSRDVDRLLSREDCLSSFDDI